MHYNTCDICKTSIDRDLYSTISIAIGGVAIAHLQCATSHGFGNFYSDYQQIINEACLEFYCDDFNHTPQYCPKISESDLTKLTQILSDSFSSFDYSHGLYLVLYFHTKYFIPITDRLEPSTRCQFCPKNSEWKNQHFNLGVCSTCLNYINSADPINPHSVQCSYLIEALDDWLRKVLHPMLKFHELISKYSLSYNRCMKCKRLFDSDDNVIITDRHMVHDYCFSPNSSHFVNNSVSFDKLLTLPQFKDSLNATLLYRSTA